MVKTGLNGIHKLFTPLESPVPLQRSFVTGPVFQHRVKYLLLTPLESFFLTEFTIKIMSICHEILGKSGLMLLFWFVVAIRE
jgi:hypothetical protein